MMPGQIDLLTGTEVPGTKDYYNRILLAGDTHGDYEHILYLFNKAKEFDCQLIFQLGDFGYWTHTNDGKYFLEEVSHLAVTTGIPFFWLDGNHENHIELRRAIADQDDDFVEIARGVYYAPRGHRWTWRGKRFMALGGAFSVDKAYRKVGYSWWPQEEIEPEELSYACRPGEVDYLLTHDLPDGVDWQRHKWMQGYGGDWRSFPEASRHQRLIRFAAEAVQPDVLYHGHMHVRYSDKLQLDTGKMIRVEALDCNQTGEDSWTILDLT